MTKRDDCRVIQSAGFCVVLLAVAASGCRSRSVGIRDDGGMHNGNGNHNGNVDAFVEPCGNGVIDPGEECDGQDLGGQTCQGLGFEWGTLLCEADCTLSTDHCGNGPGCGNGALDPPEECDGSDLGGLDCSAFGFPGGTLGCDVDCHFDLSGCSNCGNGTCEGPETPGTCPGDCPVAAVAVGSGHTCAVLSSGAVRCWGRNWGMLGDGNTDDSSVPVSVVGLTDAMEVGLGQIHTGAVRADGTVWCWG